MKIGVLDEKWEGSVEKNATNAIHKNVARELAEQSTVLLKNDNQTLPLSQNMTNKKILVIGSKNNTFIPVTSAQENSGKVDASFIVPPAWVLSDRLGVPRIENTAAPS
jgi:beta-glucosidase